MNPLGAHLETLPVDMRPVWQQEFRGLSWEDMPGGEEFNRKCNFALFRRGLYDPDMDVVEPEAVELLEVSDEEGTLRTTATGKQVRLRGKKKAMIQRDVGQRERQQAITERLALLTSAQMLLLKREFGSGMESIILRALGRFQGRSATVKMSPPIMQRVESALAALPALENRVVEMRQGLELRQAALRTRYIALARKAGRVQDKLVKSCDVSHGTVRTLRMGERMLRQDAIERLERGITILEEETARKGKPSARAERRAA